MIGKKRAKLKKLAHKLDPMINIGKNGISDNTIKEIDQLLEKNELVKIKVLNNNDDDREELLEQILQETGAIFVQLIGSILVIYRKSEEEPKIFL